MMFAVVAPMVLSGLATANISGPVTVGNAVMLPVSEYHALRALKPRGDSTVTVTVAPPGCSASIATASQPSVTAIPITFVPTSAGGSSASTMITTSMVSTTPVTTVMASSMVSSESSSKSETISVSTTESLTSITVTPTIPFSTTVPVNSSTPTATGDANTVALTNRLGDFIFTAAIMAIIQLI